MNTYIVRYFVRRESASKYSWTERFCTLAVQAPSSISAKQIAETLKPQVVGRHIESTEDPEIGDDPVEVTVQSFADYEQQLLEEAAEVSQWEPEETDDE